MRILIRVILLPIIVVALDLGDVFLFLLDVIGISTYYRKVMATVLSSSLTAPKTTPLAVLVPFATLVLGGRRLLGLLAIRYVSKKSVSKLNLLSILSGWFVPTKALGIIFSGV